ncbi:hypothetical protein DUNSADRAFT_4375, partial [Dunaliella salina]
MHVHCVHWRSHAHIGSTRLPRIFTASRQNALFAHTLTCLMVHAYALAVACTRRECMATPSPPQQDPMLTLHTRSYASPDMHVCWRSYAHAGSPKPPHLYRIKIKCWSARPPRPRHSRTPSLQGMPESSPSPSPSPAPAAQAMMEGLNLRSPSPLQPLQQSHHLHQTQEGQDQGGGYIAGSSNLITGLKQRILAHLFLCAMQRGKEAGGGGQGRLPILRQRKQQQQQLELHKFYRSFEEIKALVIWRAQLLDRDLLLLDLGSQGTPDAAAGSAAAEGAAPGAQTAVAGPQQSQYIALYDWRRCHVRAFCRATSDAAFSLLAQHADVLGADVGGGLWGRFTTHGAHEDAVHKLVASALSPSGSSAMGGSGSSSGGGGSQRPSREFGQASAGSGPGPGMAEVGPPGGPAAAAAASSSSSGAGMRPTLDRQAVVRRILGGLLPGGAQ